MLVNLTAGRLLDVTTICWAKLHEPEKVELHVAHGPPTETFTGEDAVNIWAALKRVEEEKEPRREGGLVMDDIIHIHHNFPSHAAHLEFWQKVQRGEIELKTGDDED